MKHLYITTILALIVSASFAQQQQQQLPDTTMLKLTRNELTSLLTHIDSVQNIARTSDRVTSGWFGDFERRLQISLNPIYLQIQRQVADEKKKVKKQ